MMAPHAHQQARSAVAYGCPTCTRRVPTRKASPSSSGSTHNGLTQVYAWHPTICTNIQQFPASCTIIHVHHRHCGCRRGLCLQSRSVCWSLGFSWTLLANTLQQYMYDQCRPSNVGGSHGSRGQCPICAAGPEYVRHVLGYQTEKGRTYYIKKNVTSQSSF